MFCDRYDQALNLIVISQLLHTIVTIGFKINDVPVYPESQVDLEMHKILKRYPARPFSIDKFAALQIPLGGLTLNALRKFTPKYL